LGLGTDMLTSQSAIQLQAEAENELSVHSGLADHGDSRFLAGKHLVEIGQHEAAISEFFNYLEDYPNDFLGFVYVINCLVRNGDRKQARVWSRKALDLPYTMHNQKEYPKWFAYMQRLTANETDDFEEEEEEQIEISG
jgi:Flp pilus assembly protein TadD